FDHQPAADFLLGRLIAWGALIAALPWVISQAIDLEQALAKAVVSAGFLGLRLMIKLASNVVHVAIAIVWSPVALFFGLIPETSHIGRMWLHEFFGRLAGAVLAAIAVTLGLAIAVL